MTQPLLRTKLLIPPLRQNQIKRPQLISKINQSKDQVLTLIEAPAGFGKTSLAAAWATQCSLPVAWLTLHQNDEPEERFLSYIVHSLQYIFPKIGQTTLTLIHSKPIDNAVFALLNDLSEIDHQFALVLDDYHTIDTKQNAEIVQFILDNCPPNFHLIIVTRNSPSFSLTKLRAKAQINEITINEIRFSPIEIKTFLNECMDIRISDFDITQLANTTEGWPVGLQLAALAYSRNTKDWALPVSQKQIFDYLAEEVLSRESGQVQKLLRLTSLFDRFCIPLIQYLIQDEDSLSVNLLLQHIDQANLFLIHLDHNKTWFRYHALFSEFLRKQITDEEALPYYKKASTWFKEHGMLDDAIHYAVHAGDIEPAAKMLDANYREILSRGDHISMFEWIEAIPESILQKYPRLWLTSGWAYMISLEPVEAIRCAKKAEEISKNDDHDQLIHIEAQTIITMANIFLGNTKGLSINSEDMEALSEQDDFLHSMLHFTHTLIHVLNGDTSQALDSFAHATELKTIENISLLYILTYTQAGETRCFRGAFGLGERSFLQAIEYGKQMYGENSVLLSLPYMSYGELLREQNKLIEAQEYIQTGIHFCYLWEPVFSVDGQISLARIYAAQGQWHKAFQQLENTLSQIKNSGTILNDIFVAIHFAKLHLLHGNISAASQLVNLYSLNQLGDDPYYLYELSQLMLTRLDIQSAIQNQTPIDNIISKVDALIADMINLERLTPEIEALILKTYAYHHQNKQSEVIHCLSRALTLGAQSGYIRIFADEGEALLHILIEYHNKLAAPASYVDKIQNIMLSEVETLASSQKPSKHDNLFIPLTRRELDILHRLAAGETNQEIAEQLTLSLHTVKKHVANILSKLNVGNRTQAVMLARKMSWIK